MSQPPPQLTSPSLTFMQLLSSTPRGARLARLLSVSQLRSWDAPHDLTERAEIVVAELAANAVPHGSLAGRGFRLALVFDPPASRLRLEVTDARGDLYPHISTGAATLDVFHPCGRGLSLVTAFADHWDCIPYPPAGKTVCAVLTTP